MLLSLVWTSHCRLISLTLQPFTASTTMNTELILLKAQTEALRNYFTSLLPVIFHGDDQFVWLAKYLIWDFERQNLAPYDFSNKLPTPEKDKISRRRFQLQVLMDVAYIQGQLQEHGITRIIGSVAAAQAEQVYSHSDHSEETMLPIIDTLWRSEPLGSSQSKP